MPAFRARAFLRSGLTGPGEILKADLTDIVRILVDSMPFSGKDPLTAKSAPSHSCVGHADAAGDVGQCTADAGSDSAQHSVCAALAVKIKRRCKEVLKDELLAAAKEVSLMS